MTRCAGDCTHSFLSISYDADGNRLTLDVDGTLTPYSYTSGSNRLAAVGTDPVPTDVEGRITETAEYRYAWSQASRLDTVYRKVGPIEVEEARYTYDAFGLRRTKTTATGTTVYHYSEEGLLLAETTGDGQAVRTYVWAGSTPIAQVAELLVPPAVPGLPPTSIPQLTYLHVDHLDTPRWGTDEAGDLVWRWPSDGFGQTPPDEDPDGDGVPVSVNLRFPGQYHDAESGLAYNRFRYYAPGLGRYLSPDPIGQAGGTNAYAYAWVNPVALSDSTGLLPILDLPTMPPFIPDPFDITLEECEPEEDEAEDSIDDTEPQGRQPQEGGLTPESLGQGNTNLIAIRPGSFQKPSEATLPLPLHDADQFATIKVTNIDDSFAGRFLTDVNRRSVDLRIEGQFFDEAGNRVLTRNVRLREHIGVGGFVAGPLPAREGGILNIPGPGQAVFRFENRSPLRLLLQVTIHPR